MTSSLEDYTAYVVGRGLYVYLTPCLLLVGLLGNVLCFVVLSKRMTSAPPTYLYLAVLAVVDIVALFVPGVRGWLTYTVGVDMMLLLNCSWYFILYFSACNTSVYIVVCVSVDRFIHTYKPISAKAISTVKSARITLVVVGVAMVLVNMHYPWTLVRVSDGANSSKCVAAEGFEFWISTTWPYLDLTIYAFVPVTILTTLNLAIVFKLTAQRRKLRQIGPLTNQPVQTKQQTRTTLMLVCLSLIMMITTSPVVALHIVETYWDRTDPAQEALHLLATAICEHLMYLNNCLNFLLYFLSARKFRVELKNLFRRRNKVAIVTAIEVKTARTDVQQIETVA